MVLVKVAQLEPGDKLLTDVRTARGNKLFHKGSVIDTREIEILHAFFIKEVEIQQREIPKPEKNVEVPAAAPEFQKVETGAVESVTFQKHYRQLLSLMKKVFKSTSGSESLPIVELRSHLEELVKEFDHEDLLTFSARTNSSEDYLYHKSIIVALASYLIAVWMKFQKKDLIPVALAGLLHDIGNMGVDPAILNKPGKLTEEEMEEVKKHTVIGYNRLKNVLGINEGVKLAALQHHEREDGSGYPLGVKGDKIHTYAKVVAVADIFYAMTQARKHKVGQSPYVVLDQLYEDSFGKLDPAMVRTFVYKITQQQLGYTVRLSDGSIGKIVYADQSNPTRPWVNVEDRTINLAQERKLYIAEVLSKIH